MVSERVLQQLASHLSTHSAQHLSVCLPVRAQCILNNLLTSLDDNNILILLHLDLSAAFDKTDHEILSRLKRDFGICGTALSLLF